MRHRKRKFTLSKTSAQRRVLARKLAIAFVTHGRLQTSRAKAQFLRRTVEPLLTKAREGDITARRTVLRSLGNREAASALLKRAEAYRGRPGGYTRMTRLPRSRAGDRSQQVVVEFV